MIYFIQNEKTGDIKIGYSIDVQKRLSQLQTATPDRLILIGQIPGSIVDERDLHHRFGDYRIRGEWFRGDLGLSEEVAAMVEAEELSRPDEESLNDAIAEFVAGFPCRVFRDEAAASAPWACHPCISGECSSWEQDPAFIDFFFKKSDHSAYRYRSASAAIYGFRTITIPLYWRDHQPPKTRLFVDGGPSCTRRARLRKTFDEAVSWAKTAKVYFRQLTDAGDRLVAYWRFAPHDFLALGLMYAWKEHGPFATCVDAYDSIEHHFDGQRFSFPEKEREYASHCDEDARRWELIA